jgi:hypothetical protein
VNRGWLLKLLLVPTLIALITLAGRRWGPAVAGWLAGFPVVAGPILLMVGIEQGPAFAAQGAQSALTAVLANLAFSVGYSWAALRFPWYGCLVLGVLAFGVAGTLLSVLPLPLWVAVILTLAGLRLAPRAFPKREFIAPLARPSPLELPARMVAGAALTVSVTLFAQRLGPAFSGLFAVFPVMSLVFGVFSHLTWGAAGAIRLLSGMVRGLYAFVAFCPAVAIAVPRFGLAVGFLLALGCALLVQAATFRRA